MLEFLSVPLVGRPLEGCLGRPTTGNQGQLERTGYVKCRLLTGGKFLNVVLQTVEVQGVLRAGRF